MHLFNLLIKFHLLQDLSRRYYSDDYSTEYRVGMRHAFRNDWTYESTGKTE